MIKVIRIPQFSIAPAPKSGMAIMSIFGRGYGALNVFSKNCNTFGPITFAYSTCSMASRRAQILKVAPFPMSDSLLSKSLIVYATYGNANELKNRSNESVSHDICTRYVDIGTVTSNLSRTHPGIFSLVDKFKVTFKAWSFENGWF